MNTTNFPENIKKHLLDILEKERNYVGEKPIEQGFLIKRSKDKATIAYDDGSFIYALRMIREKNNWRVIGFPSKWDNIQELLNMN